MRVISSEKDLKKLPMGALVVNGTKIGRREEALKELEYWREHKLDRWKTS